MVATAVNEWHRRRKDWPLRACRPQRYASALARRLVAHGLIVRRSTRRRTGNRLCWTRHSVNAKHLQPEITLPPPLPLLFCRLDAERTHSPLRILVGRARSRAPSLTSAVPPPLLRQVPAVLPILGLERLPHRPRVSHEEIQYEHWYALPKQHSDAAMSPMILLMSVAPLRTPDICLYL
ncbi:hypothetical protein HRbin30_00762 [bacterium HR30]|nr:hypothetical protein HRbin30_00762 [bacterium HR30]